MVKLWLGGWPRGELMRGEGKRGNVGERESCMDAGGRKSYLLVRPKNTPVLQLKLRLNLRKRMSLI